MDAIWQILKPDAMYDYPIAQASSQKKKEIESTFYSNVVKEMTRCVCYCVTTESHAACIKIMMFSEDRFYFSLGESIGARKQIIILGNSTNCL